MSSGLHNPMRCPYGYTQKCEVLAGPCIQQEAFHRPEWLHSLLLLPGPDASSLL